MTDLTDRMQQMVALDQTLVFTGTQIYGLAADRPAYKALPHFALQTAVLYQYTNGPLRLLTIKDPGDADKDKSFSIRPESQDLVVKPTAWSTDGWTIIAVFYGGHCFNEDQTVMNKIQHELTHKTPQSVLFTNELVGTDPWVTHIKTGTIFYRGGEEGRMRIAVGLKATSPATLTDVLAPEGVSSSNTILSGVLSADKDAKIHKVANASGTTVVNLNPPYSTTPRILFGLRWMGWLKDVSNSFTLGYEVCPDTADEESFAVRAWTGAETQIWEVQASWMTIPRKTSFQLDSGYPEHGGYQSSGLAGNIQKITLSHTFKKPFSAPPKVICWIVNLDLKKQQVDYYGIDTGVTAISATGFSMSFWTWSVLHFAAVKIGWFAYDADQDDNRVKVNSWRTESENLNRRWDFTGQPFRGTPATFCAISRFDFNTATNIRLACNITNTNSAWADIELSSWM